MAGKLLTIGGMPVVGATRAEFVAMMARDCERASRGDLPLPLISTSANGSVIARFHRDAAYRSLMEATDMVDADGMPLVIASRLLCKTPLPERVATTDFIHDAAQAAAAKGIRFYFLGAKPGVAQIAADHFRNLYPGLQIVGVRDGYFAPEKEDEICASIRELKVDVLWIGLGSPRQEAFAARNRSKLAGVAWIKTCGGLFDHYSGKIVRAPVWMRELGLEWLHRMIKEPMRLGPRYLTTNLVALFYLLAATSDSLKSVAGCSSFSSNSEVSPVLEP